MKMAQVGGTAKDPIKAVLAIIIRERATEARFTLGMVPEVRFIAPFEYHGNIHHEDLIAWLEAPALTPEDVTRFLRTTVPQTNRTELAVNGTTQFELELKQEELDGLFLVRISGDPYSTDIVARLIKRR